MTIVEMLDANGRLIDAYRTAPRTPDRPATKVPAIDSTRDVIDALGDGSEDITYADGVPVAVTVSAARYAELLEQSRWGAR